MVHGVGERQLEPGPSGFGRKYGTYVDWNKSLLRTTKLDKGISNINKMILQNQPGTKQAASQGEKPIQQVTGGYMDITRRR
jgi:hypothetical protein